MLKNADPAIRATSPTIHLTVALSIVGFIAILAASVILRVEVVAQGTGKIVPASRVQVVQSEFDGKISAIHVENGSAVEKGDILIELDRTATEVDLNTLINELGRLSVESSRISAFVKGLDSYDLEDDKFHDKVLSDFESSKFSDSPYYPGQRRLLAAEIDSLGAALQTISNQVVANTKAIRVTKARIAKVDASYLIQSERIEMVQGLLEGGNVSRSGHLDLIEVATGLEKEREIYNQELNLQRSEGVVLASEKQNNITSKYNQLLQRLAEIDARKSQLEEELRVAQRRALAAQLTAPLDGVVNELKVFTVGGIAASGEELLHIVPHEQEVEFEATFSNEDIGFMTIGQKANIKLDAYPAERFGFVRGHVTNMAADAIELEGGKWGFVVRVVPNEFFLQAEGTQYSLRPGMTATIHVTTGKRRIITYFFAPIVATLQSAMGER